MSLAEELHEALVHIAELEAQQAVLVKALKYIAKNYIGTARCVAQQALAAVKPATATPLNIPALLSQCAELAKWRYCMSYNDSYFGEPPGELKRITAEIDRLLPTDLSRETQTQDESDESNFRRLPPEVEEAIDRAAVTPAGEGGA